MRLKTLTDTLMVEEVEEHSTSLYSKVDSCSMFGYAMSWYDDNYKPKADMDMGRSSSSFKPAEDFGMGGGGIAKTVLNTPLIERYRLDTSHGSPHINLEYGLKTSTRRMPLVTKHLKLKF